MAKKGSSGILVFVILIAAIAAAVWYFMPQIKERLDRHGFLPERFHATAKPPKPPTQAAPATHSTQAAQAQHAERHSSGRYSVSITDPAGSIAKAGRITGFEIKLHGYTVVSANVAQGWEVHMENDAVARVKGGIRVGAAANDIRAFQDFIVVEKASSRLEKPKIEMDIITTRDFEKMEHHAIAEKSIKLRRM